MTPKPEFYVTIELAYPQGRIPVPAKRISVCDRPGFAVHHPGPDHPGSDHQTKEGWQITHVETGLALTPPLPSIEEAIEIAEARFLRAGYLDSRRFNAVTTLAKQRYSTAEAPPTEAEKLLSQRFDAIVERRKANGLPVTKEDITAELADDDVLEDPLVVEEFTRKGLESLIGDVLLLESLQEIWDSHPLSNVFEAAIALKSRSNLNHMQKEALDFLASWKRDDPRWEMSRSEFVAHIEE